MDACNLRACLLRFTLGVLFIKFLNILSATHTVLLSCGHQQPDLNVYLGWYITCIHYPITLSVQHLCFSVNLQIAF